MATKKPVIGLLGGGQLGRMLCEAAGPLGIPIAVLDAEDCPAKHLCSRTGPDEMKSALSNREANAASGPACLMQANPNFCCSR